MLRKLNVAQRFSHRCKARSLYYLQALAFAALSFREQLTRSCFSTNVDVRVSFVFLAYLSRSVSAIMLYPRFRMVASSIHHQVAEYLFILLGQVLFRGKPEEKNPPVLAYCGFRRSNHSPICLVISCEE